MTKDDKLFQEAIIDQINAELGALRMSTTELARRMGRPYDSTRNYLVKERGMPLDVLLACASALDLPAEEIIARARARL